MGAHRVIVSSAHYLYIIIKIPLLLGATKGIHCGNVDIYI